MKYRSQILKDLQKISTPTSPGSIIVTDDSQAVIACENVTFILITIKSYLNNI